MRRSKYRKSTYARNDDFVLEFHSRRQISHVIFLVGLAKNYGKQRNDYSVALFKSQMTHWN